MGAGVGAAVDDSAALVWMKDVTSATQPTTDTLLSMQVFGDPESLTGKAFRAVDGFSPWKGRKLEIPSAVGYTNARELARLYHAIATGIPACPSMSVHSPPLTPPPPHPSPLSRPTQHP